MALKDPRALRARFCVNETREPSLLRIRATQSLLEHQKRRPTVSGAMAEGRHAVSMAWRTLLDAGLPELCSYVSLSQFLLIVIFRSDRIEIFGIMIYYDIFLSTYHYAYIYVCPTN